ncbi:DUF1850 domain-containing protein [Ornithinibacillus contaminans]|uniref:DUF1850 domain-containing protein n=1 Tax=Ornithinibacillus contaminans TaxID=694055 RepID=UPI00069D331B|nr:DUF1850 domain-containing protein [Ornithinibacillus contaminans]
MRFLSNKRFIISILLLVVLSIILLVPLRTALVFYKENTNQIAAYLPVEEGDNFQIIFTHSIHLTDVVEMYEVLPDHSIRQAEIIYEHYGIGMPANAGAGETFVYEDGKYHIKDMNRIFPSIVLRNGKTVPKHRLVWGAQQEHMVWFRDYFEPGAIYTIKIDQLSLWDLLRGVKIHE